MTSTAAASGADALTKPAAAAVAAAPASPCSFCGIPFPGWNDFLVAQAKVAAVVLVASIGNKWSPSYPRNDNHNPTMFWVVNAFLAVATVLTWRHKENKRGVVLLSRAQTEEWKGWMQWAFIFYHYYRVYYVYNEIRVFVSAYVWMTGFGNFLYFEKKKDFSIERIVSMVIRINYFPVMLSVFLGVPMELYYVVPLHTVGFFVTMATCYLAARLQEGCGMGYWKSRIAAVLVALAVHVAFYETSAVDSLLLISKEIHFRFQADKYSAWQGIVGGLLYGKASEFLNWAYGGDVERSAAIRWIQRLAGASLIWVWWYAFGFMSDKFQYNPVHPYIFSLPVYGWLMIRNSSRYLTESYSGVLEFLGRNTLETYVLQFHLFMCMNVQHIPEVIPGSGPDGPLWIKTANMLLCGSLFVTMAVVARHNTVETQTTVVEFVEQVRKSLQGKQTHPHADEERDSMLKAEEGSGGVKMKTASG